MDDAIVDNDNDTVEESFTLEGSDWVRGARALRCFGSGIGTMTATPVFRFGSLFFGNVFGVRSVDGVDIIADVGEERVVSDFRNELSSIGRSQFRYDG